MPFYVDGKVVENAFDWIEKPKGKFAVFRRVNYRPFTMQSPRGPIERHIASIGIPTEFTTLKKPDGNTHETMRVKYFRSESDGPNGMKIHEPAAIELEKETIKFDITTAEGWELYKLFTIHPFNVAIGARMGDNMPAIFEYYDSKAAAQKANLRTINENKAIALAYDEDKVPDKVAVNIHKYLLSKNAQEFPVATAELIEVENYAQIRLDLANYAKRDFANFSKLVENANLGLRGKITDCVNAGVIFYSHAESQWVWKDTEKERKNKVLKIVPVGEDAVDELVSWIVSSPQGKNALADLETELKAKKVTA